MNKVGNQRFHYHQIPVPGNKFIYVKTFYIDIDTVLSLSL